VCGECQEFGTDRKVRGLHAGADEQHNLRTNKKKIIDIKIREFKR
jgi:hypothetical protein